MTTEEREKIVTQLREIADLYDGISESSLEAFPKPYLSKYWFNENVTIQEFKDGDYTTDKDKSLSRIAAINRGLRGAGKRNKEYDGDDFQLEIELPSGFTLTWYVDRTVTCRKIVKGTKVIPASTYTTPERVEEEVEWVCDEVVLLSK